MARVLWVASRPSDYWKQADRYPAGLPRLATRHWRQRTPCAEDAWPFLLLRFSEGKGNNLSSGVKVATRTAPNGMISFFIII